MKLRDTGELAAPLDSLSLLSPPPSSPDCPERGHHGRSATSGCPLVSANEEPQPLEGEERAVRCSQVSILVTWPQSR